VFRRKSKGESADEEAESPAPAADADLVDDDSADVEAHALSQSADADAVTAATAQGSGPYDVDEAPTDEIPRIDLGALRVPLIEGLEVRLDMDEQTGEPTQLVLADGESMLQLGVFAAPRSAGIWPEVRQEIAESLQAAGGSCEEVEGPVGTELTASVPTGEPGMVAPARFIGVDRPRWFLRGLLSGPAAVDQAAAGRLEFALRSTVVVRGKDAMPIRDPLPLRLPPEAVQLAQEQLEASGEADSPTLEQLDPGPTITETR
jgi:hypothetical protein